jgi:peptidoglycan lytic transglycosylase
MKFLRTTALLSATGCLLALAGWLLPGGVDGKLDSQVTGSIAGKDENGGDTSRTLLDALEALGAGDAEQLRTLRRKLPVGGIDARVLTWATAHSGSRAVTSAEIADAMKTLDGWPGMNGLRSNYEKALARENPGPVALVEAYRTMQPETLAGAISLARAHLRLGDDAKANAVLAPWWRREAINGSTELRMLAEFSGILTKEDHRQRFLAMMYRDRIRSAERVAGLADAEDMLKPWAAAIRKQKDTEKLLDKASDAFKATPHHLFARITYLRRLERDEKAAKLLLKSPVGESGLVDPDEWWIERRIVSRDAFERGDFETAYRIAAMHRGGSPETQVEAAFHAGWYALRGLKNAKQAAAHFARIEEMASGNLSRSRGAYWLARAREAMKSPDADADYRRAALYAGTYYGQLARQKLGLPLDDPRRPSVTAEDRMAFDTLEPVAAMRRLQAIGQDGLARQLAFDLGRSLENIAAVTQLVVHWELQDQRFIALRIAKAAEWRGVETGALTHPIGAIPASTPIKDGERPLAYAIARQESEFNVAARSRANARGLMQLLPGTAREVAQQKGLNYTPALLDTDGAYNATLGTAYLNSQLDRFDGSYILTFVAYNAGPGRAREWLKRFGDPRGKSLEEVIDWVEMIPFTETRNYVQRVMENLQIYKARLGQPTNIADDLRFGRKS